MATLTASEQKQDVSGPDWTQWMQWDGQAEAPTDTKDPSIKTDNTDMLGLAFSQAIPPYPVSPSTTANGEGHSSMNGKNHTTRAPHDLPTPSHSSESPDSPVAPFSRLSGETLWDRALSEDFVVGNKRKFSDDSSPTESTTRDAQKPAPKKRPHNIIEKRYRANLNEKIAELRDSVPSLRVAKKPTNTKEEADDDEEDLDGSTSTNKLNKASILTKATEYIRHLELRNKKLEDENLSLKQRYFQLERVLAQGGNSSERRAAAFTTDDAVEQPAHPPTSDETADTTKNPPHGLIPVSDIWRKFRATSTQSTQHYGDVYNNPEEGSGRRGWPTKLMVGSLAGLMIMEGLSESDQGSDSNRRGLFGIPLEFLDGWWFLRSPQDFISAFMTFCRSGGFFPMIKGFTALTIAAFLVFTYLFNSKPTTPPAEEEKAASTPERPPSLASPIEVRRAAWLTSTQILHIPHHSFFPEWLALTNEWLKYTVRIVLGWPMYTWLTGRSGEDELARVKAWDIAIDAQLAGGDIEISRSRLVLTIFASGLLPRTPARLMLKALHTRVLLHSVGSKGSYVEKLWNRVASFFAHYEWDLAQRIHATLPIDHPDRLPRYAAAMLARDCEEVMLDSVLQRAYNLMYNRPTTESTDPEDSLMDVVVEDHAVRSPLDALSAWYSSHQLRQALIASLSHSPSNVNHEFDYLLHSAIALAPEGSAAQTRAIAIKAVFFDGMRAANIQTVLAALPPSRSGLADPNAEAPQGSLPYLIDSSTPTSACDEISNALQCAMTMAMLQSPVQDDAMKTTQASTLFANLPVSPMDMGLLSFAPVYHVLHRFTNLSPDGKGLPSPMAPFSRPVKALYHWSRIEGPDSAFLTDDVMRSVHEFYEIVEKSGSSMSRRQSHASNDTGYVSSEEADRI